VATIVTSSIGTGGDYSTPQAWEDACPSNLVTDDKVWRGECKNQTFTGGVTFSGVTTDATRYIELTTEAGASFRDHADAATNPLRLDTTKGATLEITSGGNSVVAILAANVRISKLQLLKSGGWDHLMYSSSAGPSWTMENCILENKVGGCGYHETSAGNHYIRNCIFIQDTSGNDFNIYFRNAGDYYLYNCVFVRPSNRTPYNKAIFADWANVYCYNTAAFGYLGFAQAWTDGTYNACDYAISFGSNNLGPLTYADQFENTSSASGTHDFRLKAGADLIDAGTDLSANGVTTDIIGTARGATYDIGAWEVEEATGLIGSASITLAPATTSGYGGQSICPTVAAVSPSIQGTNATSRTVTLPTHAAGQMLVVVVSSDGAPTISVNAGSSSTGWQKLGQSSNGSIVTGAVFWKVADSASETLVLTTSASEQTTALAYVINNATNLDGTPANGSSTNSDPPNLAPAAGTKDYLWIATRSGDAAVVATVAPSGYSGLETRAGGTGGASTNAAWKLGPASSSEDPGTFTSNTEQWVSYTLAVWGAGLGHVNQILESAQVSTDGSSGLPEILGTSDLQLGGASVSSDGVVAIAAAGAVSLGAATTNASGAVEIQANVDRTLGSATISAASSLEIFANVTIGLGGATVSAAGILEDSPRQGDLDIGLAAVSISAESNISIIASTTSTLETISVITEGVLSVSGSVNGSLLDSSVTTNGSLSIVADATNTLSGITPTAAGSLAIIGDSNISFDSVIIDAGSSLFVVGNSTLLLDSAAIAINGVVSVEGNSTPLFENVNVGSLGSLTITGDCGSTLSNVSVASDGTFSISADLTVTLAEVSVNGSSNLPLIANLASTLSPLDVSSDSEISISADATTQLEDSATSSSGVILLQATTAIELSSASISATGVSEENVIYGDLTSILADATVSGTGGLEVRSSLDKNLAHASISSQSVINLSSAANVLLSNVDTDITGALKIDGDVGLLLGGVETLSSSNITITGSVSSELASTTSEANSTLSISGDSTIALSDTTLTATGSTEFYELTGETSAALGSVLTTATGVVSLTGNAQTDLAAAQLISSAQLIIVGTSPVSLEPTTVVSSGGYSQILGALTSQLESVGIVTQGKIALSSNQNISLNSIEANISGSISSTANFSSILANVELNSITLLEILGISETTLSGATIISNGSVVGVVVSIPEKRNNLVSERLRLKYISERTRKTEIPARTRSRVV